PPARQGPSTSGARPDGPSTVARWRPSSSWRARTRRRTCMWALSQPRRPGTRPLLADTPARLLVALACVAAASRLLAGRTPLAAVAMRVVGVAAGHGALLATALAWAGCGRGSGLGAVVLLGAGAAAGTGRPPG